MDPPAKQGEWAGPWLGFRRGDSMVQDTAGFGKKTLFIFLAFRAGEAGLAGSHTAAGSMGAPRGKGELRDCPQGATGPPPHSWGDQPNPQASSWSGTLGFPRSGRAWQGSPHAVTAASGSRSLGACHGSREVPAQRHSDTLASQPSWGSDAHWPGLDTVGVSLWPPPSLRAGSGQDSPEGQKGYGGGCRGVRRRTGPLVQL